MSRRKRRRRGISLGTVVTLLLTFIVLGCFILLIPKLTGSSDVRIDAAQLAVAIDNSFSQIGAAVSHNTRARVSEPPQPTILPPENLATAVPVTPPPKISFTFRAAGSIKINSAVQKALTDDDGYHFSYLLEALGTAMGADLSIATLENNVIPTAKLSNANIPVEALTSIRQAGIDALCLGYYGILDGGIDGLMQTRQSMEAADIIPYGVYATQEQRQSGTIVNANGVSVALLSYQNDLSSAGKKKTSREEQDFAFANQQLPTIAADIASMREAGAQVVVVSLCWGKTGATSPTGTQKELAQGIADAGADVIIGTHPGVLQNIEILTADRNDGVYHPVLCAYSLGNLFTYDREKRAGLASVLLGATIEYDPVTGSVAFDDLVATPTYSWRDKEDDKTRYRVLLNNGNYPDYVDKDQQSVMERCKKIVTDALEGSPITIAE